VLRYAVVTPEGQQTRLHLLCNRRAARDLFVQGAGAERHTAPPFEVESVTEVALGAGAEQISFSLDPPLPVSGARRGEDVLLTVTLPPGESSVTLRCGRGSTHERRALAQLLDAADKARLEGALGEARRLYVEIQRRFPATATRARAAALEAGLVTRAESALEEAAAIERDIALVQTPSLLDGAEQRCHFVVTAFPGSDWAKRAQRLLHNIDEQRRLLVTTQRTQAANALLDKGRAHLRGNRYRLSRLYFRLVLERYEDLPRVRADATRDLAFAEKQLKKEGS
jgi:hypothetical protein